MSDHQDPYLPPAVGMTPKFLKKPTRVEWLVIAAICFTVLALMVPAVQQAHTPANRNRCRNNLKMIGLALHNYHDVYQCFPPAYLTDSEGRPAHSWRVLILPFLDEQALYDLYRFDEPWNGPNNSKLLDSMPTVFACPIFCNSSVASAKDAKHLTTYMAINDSGAAFDGPNAHRIQQFSDGTSNTIMATEVRQFANIWMAPDDISTSQFKTEIRESEGSNPGNHKDGLQVLMADGSTRFLPYNIDEESLDALATLAAGDTVSDEF